MTYALVAIASLLAGYAIGHAFASAKWWEVVQKNHDTLEGYKKTCETWQKTFPIMEQLLEERIHVVANCDHDFVDARNEVVHSGEVCLKCGAGRAGNQP